MATGDLQSIPNTLVGGDVITILARQAIRLNALKASADFKARINGLQSPVYTPPSVFVAAVPVTVRTQEAYQYQSTITEHSVESGAVLSDHVLLRPVKIDLSFEVSNWEEGRAQYAKDLLTKMWRDRKPVTLITQHDKLDNMVLVNLQADNSIPVWGRLAFRASFQQVTFISIESKRYPAEKVVPAENTGGPDSAKSAEAAVDSGQQTPRASFLSGLFN